MLITHLHFDGNCKEAIAIYEKAFQTKADIADYASDGEKISHASMEIHGSTVYLNDALPYLHSVFGEIDCTAHLIVTFSTTTELLACYEVLKADDSLSPFQETPYSKLTGNFVDKLGVLWGFMVFEE